MDSMQDINIFRARHRHVVAMARVFLKSFDLDASVKLMYTKEDMGPVIQEILHDYMDDDSIDFRLAVTKGSDLVVGWMSLDIIRDARPVPDIAFNEMTSWGAQRLLRGDRRDRRVGLAAELEDRSRRGQAQHMPRHRVVVNTIVTDPNYRRLGVAGKLLGSAVERARSVNWGIWAQTPAAYVGLFWQNGFHEVGAFGLDLDAFKPPEGVHGMRLGCQTWRQMKMATRAESWLEEAAADETAKPATTTGG